MTILAIYGAGGFARELVGMASSSVFVSDNPEEIGQQITGIRVLSFDELKTLANEDRVETVVAIAEASVRRKICDRLTAAGLSQQPAIAPSAIIGADVEIGEGAIFCHNTVVTASAKIGRSFHANIYSYVAHDCVIGDYVTLAPRASINGNAIVEDDAYIGTGAILKQGSPGNPLRIGKGAIVGMGAVVTKDVLPGAVVVGNPARPLDPK